MIETWLQEWFAARGATLARDQNYFDANAIDSFGVIEMIEAIEDHFKVKFRQHDFQDRRFATIAGLAEIISGHTLGLVTAETVPAETTRT
jgi:acyl carrier protein